MEATIGFTVLPKLKRNNENGDYDFIGREALQKHRELGLQRRLICLTVPIQDDGEIPIFSGM